MDLLPPVIPTIPPPPPPSCDNSVYASAYFLYMTRRDPAPTPLVSFEATPGTGDILDASAFNFGWRDGFEGRVGFFHCRIGADVGGFMLRSWNSIVLTTLGGSNVVLETNPVTTAAEIATVLGYNETELDGADANIDFKVSNNLTLFGGVAYVRLADYLLIGIHTPGDPSAPTFPNGYGDYSWTVLNNMVGPQIGLRATAGSLTPGSFFVGGDLRGGVLFNHVSNALFVERNAPLADLTGNDTTSSIVPMVGGSVKVGFQATASLSFTVGYRFLWLGNVALAPDQVALTPNLNIAGPGVPIGTSANSNFLAHGVEIGVHLHF